VKKYVFKQMNFVGEKYDNRYTSIIGWAQNTNNEGYRAFFSRENMSFISEQITRILRQYGLGNIKVSDRVIGGAMSDIIRSQNPILGDIITRYTIPHERDDLKSMTDQTITVIVNQIVSEHEQMKCNSKLNIWSSLLGDFNVYQIRAHPIIKTKDNTYMKGVFMYNY
jgi:hypothetical protein